MAKLLHQLGDVHEAGETALQPVTAPVRAQFHRSYGFAECSRPRIEMLERAATQRIHLQVTLHCEHFSHCVRDRRPGGEDHTASFVARLDMLNLKEKIERAFRSSLRQSGDARHFCHVKQILEPLRLVDEEAIDSK
ncbi:MAG: hypothetical protein ACREMT_07080, partial [Vulcanimicrobiaceae bacterium]